MRGVGHSGRRPLGPPPRAQSSAGETACGTGTGFVLRGDSGRGPLSPPPVPGVSPGAGRARGQRVLVDTWVSAQRLAGASLAGAAHQTPAHREPAGLTRAPRHRRAGTWRPKWLRCGRGGPSLEPRPRVWERGSRKKGTSVCRRPGGFLEAGVQGGGGGGRPSRKLRAGGAAAETPASAPPGWERLCPPSPCLCFLE